MGMFDKYESTYQPPRAKLDLTTRAGNNSEALTITDLETDPELLEPIRAYMIDRKGKQFANMDAEEVIDKFTKHMRFFNTNEAVTVSEALYMKKADGFAKRRAGEAYSIYDKLGNVFVNDGLSGAISGVGDYIQSIATSPSTYFGLGAGKLVSKVAGKAAVDGVKKAAQQAYMQGFRENGKEFAQKAFNDVVKKAANKKAFYAAGLTGVADAGVVVGQDAILQTTEIDAQSREFYDPFQTLFSAAGSGLGTGLAMRAIPGRKEKTDISGVYKKTRRARFKTQLGISLKKEQKEKLSGAVLKNVQKMTEKSGKYAFFRQQAFKGEEFLKGESFLEQFRGTNKKAKFFREDADGNLIVEKFIPATKTLPAELIKDKTQFLSHDALSTIIGSKKDGTYILDTLDELEISLPSGMSEGGKIAYVLQQMSEGGASQLGKIVYHDTGIHLGETADILARNLSTVVSRSIQNAAQSLAAVQGSAINSSKALASGNVKFKLNETDALIEEAVELMQETPQGSVINPSYIQNTWKRLLVSAPQTTAANVLGFGGYYAANSVAELFQTGTYGMIGLIKGGPLTESGTKNLAQAKALFELQSIKLKNFFDPYTTFDTYLEVLDADPKAKRRIFETFAGGIERTADRFNIDKANLAFNITEGVVDFANKVSAVKLQDSVTKSQMFMASIDKQLRLQKATSFSDVLSKGDLTAVDNDIMDAALDDTMKSVFAFDYTRKAKSANNFEAFFRSPGNLGASIAKQVENISNAPGFGFILPFGRFMNNVFSTAYHWNPITGAMPFMAAVSAGKKIEAVEAASRGFVGGMVLKLSSDYQAQQEKKGYAWNEMETGSGDVVDITNMFPFSLAMVAGRYMNVSGAGGDTKDLTIDLLQQLAIGQAATDLQFGSDLTKIVAMVQGMITEGDGDAVKALMGGMGATVGNVLAGATRPLDPVNRLIGIASGTDTAIDRRQADGLGKLTVNASRYVDNIVEMLSGKLMGEELRVGVREGEVYDPSPIRSLTGFKIKQPRTSANMVFGMVNLPDWKVSMYSGIPEHDNFVNKVMTPLLEQESELLLKNKKFMRGDIATKRLLADEMLKKVKATVTEVLSDEPDTEQGLNYRKKKLDRVKGTIFRKARRILGINTAIRDMTLEEVELMEAGIQVIKDDIKN